MYPLSSPKFSQRQIPTSMPRIKPKAILSRVLLGESRHKEDGLDYLYTGLQHHLFLGLDSDAHIRRTTDRSDENDRSSICSFSTTATADNLPGTGRAVDTYIFQPVGRWIERVAMRFTIASLHPARIAQYLDANNVPIFYPAFDDSLNLHDAIARISSRERNGSTVVAGMKGLVKQTQSSSINRSACALAALIRVSLVCYRKEIYANVSRIEPIFYLETLTGSLVGSHPEKKWLLLLVKLARETAIAVRVPPLRQQIVFDPVLGREVWQLRPSLKSAHKLRQRLIRVLKIYRLSGLDSLEDTIGESCAICAEVVSTCIYWCARGDAYMHILETVYFTVIFILRSIHELTDFANLTANRHVYIVLRTIACWINRIVYESLYAFRTHEFDMDLLKARIAFRSLLVDSDKLLPLQVRYRCNKPFVDTHTLPRRHRDPSERDEDIPPVQSLIEAAKRRTRRLLRSIDELQREVWGCASRTNSSFSQFEIDAYLHWPNIEYFEYEWRDYSKSSLERARKIQAPETILTEEFREARKIGVSRNLVDRRNWCYYQLRHDSRHRWGQHLRSTMDWDWDLATCMKHLFKVKKQKRGGPPQTAPASSTAIDMAAGPGGTMKISIGEAQEDGLPKEMQVVYTTKTGETRCISFVSVGTGPNPDSASTGAGAGPSTEQNFDLAATQQVSGHKKVSFGGEQEDENPETGVFPSDVSQPIACEHALVEEFNEGCEWKEPVYNARYDEVRAREDTLSICSLD